MGGRNLEPMAIHRSSGFLNGLSTIKCLRIKEMMEISTEEFRMWMTA